MNTLTDAGAFACRWEQMAQQASTEKAQYYAERLEKVGAIWLGEMAVMTSWHQGLLIMIDASPPPT